MIVPVGVAVEVAVLVAVGVNTGVAVGVRVDTPQASKWMSSRRKVVGCPASPEATKEIPCSEPA